jgi:hypothetical protein
MRIVIRNVQSRTHIVDELAFGLGHGGQNLYPLVRRHEPVVRDMSSCLCPWCTIKHILGKGLLYQLNELSVMPGKGHEFVRIHNVAVRFVCVGIDAECLCETSVALCDLTLVRTVRGESSRAPGQA